jgi:hypothetical protein
MLQPTDPTYILLKDFQPAGAAIVAVCAAILAFAAVMIRIKFDAATARSASINRKLGLYFRTLVAAEALASLAKSFATEAAGVLEQLKNEKTGRVDSLSWAWCANQARAMAKTIPDLNQAWRQLEEMPVESMSHLQKLRMATRTVAEDGANVDRRFLSREDIRAGVESFDGFREPFWSETLQKMSFQADTVAKDSAQLIAVLRPAMAALEAEQAKLSGRKPS